jgi:hypothetical protein
MPSPKLSTSTIDQAGKVLPWLAADGVLAYSPEQPPDRDYVFQYSWILRDVFADHTNKRRHYYFGAAYRGEARQLFAFWQAAWNGGVRRIVHCAGAVEAERITAPLAAYLQPASWRAPEYLLVQHGSYQLVPVEDQPLLESGEVLLYRGVQEAPAFRRARFDALDALDSAQRETWRRYIAVQAYVLSDAIRSFNSIHDRAARCETQHIRDRSWMTDDIAREYGLDIDHDGFAKSLWNTTHQSFALARWVAERKFGPNYVVCKTPLTNIRITTFFADEHEVRIIDPRLLDVVETHGCVVEDAAPT